MAAAHDNVYSWLLDLSDFDSASPLARDLQHLPRERRVVRIKLTFKRGLYPFFPPLVQVIAPRLAGPMHLALTTHAAVAWPTWKATRTIADVMAAFRQVLEAHGRVVLDAPGTATFVNRGADAYAPLEQHAMLLTALSATEHSKAAWMDDPQHQALAR